jgi:hypothetical protein
MALGAYRAARRAEVVLAAPIGETAQTPNTVRATKVHSQGPERAYRPAAAGADPAVKDSRDCRREFENVGHRRSPQDQTAAKSRNAISVKQ